MREATIGLARLVAEAELETAERRARRPLPDIEAAARRRPAALDLARAVRRAPRLGIVAEMKAKSPTMGEAPGLYSPARLAWTYQAAGAAAISVLCQGASFGGSPEHLAEARAATSLPLLRKDFVVDEYQVFEARALGADAVLLIVAALEDGRLQELAALVEGLGMTALVEVHGEAELERALAARARVVGVNHRDLRTFEVDLGLTGRLAPRIPGAVTVIAESGVSEVQAARRLRQAGAHGILVGEALMRATDPAARLRQLAAA
jgi:indole-3-glycerol phosphate synthase